MRGAKSVMKKWSRGKATKLTACFFRSQFKWTGNRMHVATPLMKADAIWFRDAIGVLPTDLRDQKHSHTGASPAIKRVTQLETLEAIVTVCLLPHHIQHRVDELCTLGVVSLRSIVVRASLSEHKVDWPELPSGRPRTDAVYGSRLEVHENRAEHVAATGGTRSNWKFESPWYVPVRSTPCSSEIVSQNSASI